MVCGDTDSLLPSVISHGGVQAGVMEVSLMSVRTPVCEREAKGADTKLCETSVKSV